MGKAKPQRPGETTEAYEKRLKGNERQRKSAAKKKAEEEAKKAEEEAKKERERERKRIYKQKSRAKKALEEAQKMSSPSELETLLQQFVASALQNPGDWTPEQVVSLIASISNAAKMMKEAVSSAAKLEPHQSAVIQEALRSGCLSILADMAGTTKNDATNRARQELEENK
mmetsp:Transcript_18578/g.44854  ORF Transcript_18578/g.44854 Transcript_18578/m.44854 type:complete len:171 (-) Transcript_18578:178-690(-)|eukprot:CAMPEP_0113501734 /NCGR_PEP_ID=MMETSP0014_2-20120614/33126_1 /TAXON_ID=2857 /ORGANISM="Nitzschia sp." /LENGTH=170 /DNA_ID=CAMNT_0000396369 /DNA_START=539 /DNA_END=1051 /DNA_ORIENTATION=+ /assembly_acc=CAM_ASM_000159